MATSRWVVNASPLSLLGKTDNLDLLIGLADSVVIPQSVADEIGAKPDGILVRQCPRRHIRSPGSLQE